MPLITPEGYAIGTICVMDFKPQNLSIEKQETLRRLAQQLVSLLEHRRRMIELDETMRELDKAHAALTREKAQTEELLNRILRVRIADELKANGKVEPRFHPSATILFADVKGFTSFTERAEPALLIGMLDRYFAAFDEAVARHKVEKLKTIGDAYVAVAGVPELDRLHVLHACLAALEMLEATAKNPGRARKVAPAVLRASHRHPYRLADCRRSRQPALHLRHLGRCSERCGTHGKQRRAGADQCFRASLSLCEAVLRVHLPWLGRGQE